MGMVLLWNDRQRINEYITSFMKTRHFSLSVATENKDMIKSCFGHDLIIICVLLFV